MRYKPVLVLVPIIPSSLGAGNHYRTGIQVYTRIPVALKTIIENEISFAPIRQLLSRCDIFIDNCEKLDIIEYIDN